jgi:hypothetical protein
MNNLKITSRRMLRLSLAGKAGDRPNEMNRETTSASQTLQNNYA